MVSSGILRRVLLVRTDVSEELSTSFIRVTRIDELGTTLAVTSNRRTLRRNSKFTDSFHPDEGGAKFLRKRRFLQRPHGVTSQKTPIFLIRIPKVPLSTLPRVSWQLCGLEIFTVCNSSVHVMLRPIRIFKVSTQFKHEGGS
jgi:hypothetical protein